MPTDYPFTLATLWISGVLAWLAVVVSTHIFETRLRGDMRRQKPPFSDNIFNNVIFVLQVPLGEFSDRLKSRLLFGLRLIYGLVVMLAAGSVLALVLLATYVRTTENGRGVFLLFMLHAPLLPFVFRKPLPRQATSWMPIWMRQAESVVPFMILIAYIFYRLSLGSFPS